MKRDGTAIESLLMNVELWSTMKKMKFKTFSTWMATPLVRDKVIKLQEDRQFIARLLLIQQSRPELVPRLPKTIGNYEMSATPRSMFISYESLLIPIDKASIIHTVEEANPIRTDIHIPTKAIMHAPCTQTPFQAPTQDETHDGLLKILSGDSVQPEGPDMKNNI